MAVEEKATECSPAFACWPAPFPLASSMANRRSQLDAAFAALNDPTRRAVLERLKAGPASVGELAEPHDMALPSFLGHLKKLEDAGLIVTAKSGRVRTCFLVPNTLNGVMAWVRSVYENQPRSIDRLGSFMSKGRPESP